MINIDEKLIEVKSKIETKMRLDQKLKNARNSKMELEKKKKELYRILQREELDVSKLEGMSLANVYHTMLGSKADKLEKEKEEAFAAKLKYDGACKQIDIIDRDIEDLIKKLEEFHNIESEYETLIEEKQRKLYESNTKEKDVLNNLLRKEVANKNRMKEVDEALGAGRILMDALYRVKDELQSAGNMGIWDIAGGGILATMAKHSRIDNARHEISIAQGHLEKFYRELQDIEEVIDIDIEIGGFLGFADYFFDGLFADLSVQSKINDSKRKIERTIDDVNTIIEKLKKELKELDMKIEIINKEKVNIIESSSI